MKEKITAGIITAAVVGAAFLSVAHAQTTTTTPTPSMTQSPTMSPTPTSGARMGVGGSGAVDSTTVPNGAPSTGHGE
jgi:hypothetical protein